MSVSVEDAAINPPVRVEVVNVQPGDIVVLTTDVELDWDETRRIKDYAERTYPEARFMVLGGGMRLDGVLRGVDAG
jgi:hypothetical protein